MWPPCFIAVSNQGGVAPQGGHAGPPLQAFYAAASDR